MTQAIASLSAPPAGEFKKLLGTLVAQERMNGVTDLHITREGLVYARQCGVLKVARDLDMFTDGEGRLRQEWNHPEIVETLGFKGAHLHQCGSRVFRADTTQVRAQIVPSEFPPQGVAGKLQIRIQNNTPPNLRDLLGDHAPGLLSYLNQINGMVAICGPIGAGKTTLAAAIALFWAESRGRHIATVEDPVEYQLKPKGNGEITQIAARFAKVNESWDHMVRLKETLLRADIDGLFLGEVRNSVVREICFDFAGTQEPVVTTLHSGGVTDAVHRLTTPYVGGGTTEVLYRTLGQCLSCIIYVDLAHDASKRPVPVIMALPADVPTFRSALQRGEATALSNLDGLLETPEGASEVTIGLQSAISHAMESGATAESVIRAVPPSLRKKAKDYV